MAQNSPIDSKRDDIDAVFTGNLVLPTRDWLAGRDGPIVSSPPSPQPPPINVQPKSKIPVVLTIAILSVLVTGLILYLGNSRIAPADSKTQTTPKPLSSNSKTAIAPNPSFAESLGIRMIPIPAGEFEMGSPDGDKDAS